MSDRKTILRLQDCGSDWALVTGASEGIGREFCEQLAAAGMNVAMVARRKQPMDELAAALRARHAVRTLVAPLDLSLPDAAAEVTRIVHSNGVRVRLLINNAAFGRWGKFEAASARECEEIIRLNAASLVSLCHHFLPDLIGFPSSAIINVSSPAGWQPMPYFALYAATKAFVNSFSLALHGEWQEHGVLVQTLIPGPTRTALHAKGGAYDTTLKDFASPSVAVEAAIRGLAKGSATVVTTPRAFQQRLFACLLPSMIVVRTMKRMFRPPEIRP